jgi:hypothetical protein
MKSVALNLFLFILRDRRRVAAKVGVSRQNIELSRFGGILHYITNILFIT